MGRKDVDKREWIDGTKIGHDQTHFWVWLLILRVGIIELEHSSQQ